MQTWAYPAPLRVGPKVQLRVGLELLVATIPGPLIRENIFNWATLTDRSLYTKQIPILKHPHTRVIFMANHSLKEILLITLKVHRKICLDLS